MKRRLLIIGIFLLLGAVVNVAVAWGCAVWIRAPYGATPGTLYEETRRNPAGGWDIWYLQESRRPGAAFYWSFYELGVELQQPANSDPMPSEIAPAWGSLGAPFESQREFDYRDIHGSGWPMISMWCEYADGREVIRGLALERDQTPAMPLDAIWPGFAVNTLFYATILWLLIPGPFALQRFLRARRGLCPRCAYPMGESAVCTECGNQFREDPV